MALILTGWKDGAREAWAKLDRKEMTLQRWLSFRECEEATEEEIDAYHYMIRKLPFCPTQPPSTYVKGQPKPHPAKARLPRRRILPRTALYYDEPRHTVNHVRIYFIRSGIDGPVKIGQTRDVIQRLNNLQTAHHDTLNLIRVIDGTPDLEARLHQHFADYRLRGEWFRFCDEMLTVELPT